MSALEGLQIHNWYYSPDPDLTSRNQLSILEAEPAELCFLTLHQLAYWWWSAQCALAFIACADFTLLYFCTEFNYWLCYSSNVGVIWGDWLYWCFMEPWSEYNWCYIRLLQSETMPPREGQMYYCSHWKCIQQQPCSCSFPTEQSVLLGYQSLQSVMWKKIDCIISNFVWMDECWCCEKMCVRLCV